MEIPEKWINMRCQPTDNIVLHEWKAVYVSLPKVACTSIRTVLAKLLGYTVERNVHFDVQFPVVAKADIKRDFPDYFVFAFVRNPWDRLLSCFLNKIDPSGGDRETFRNGVEFSFWKYGDMFYANMSFADFVNAIAAIPDEDADIHFGSQYRHLTDSSGKLFVDYLGRFESLSVDLAKIAAQLGMPPVELPHLVKSNHGHYSEYYTLETRELVRQRYAKDVKLFKYCFQKNGSFMKKLKDSAIVKRFMPR